MKLLIHNNISLELRKDNSYRKRIPISEILDSLQSKKIKDINLNLNKQISMDNFKTPNKNKIEDIDTDETNTNKLNISKTTYK